MVGVDIMTMIALTGHKIIHAHARLWR